MPDLIPEALAEIEAQRRTLGYDAGLHDGEHIDRLTAAIRAAWGDLAQLQAEHQAALEELARTARAIHGCDADAHMLHEAAAEVVRERDAARAEASALRERLAAWERTYGAATVFKPRTERE